MPKENTHIFFADSLLSASELSPCADTLIRPYLRDYYLGSIAPDILFYSKNPSAEELADSLHGLSGLPTNTMVMEILKRSSAPKDLAFAAGYITHCCLDMTFHPTVYYFSGNYYDTDETKSDRAKFLHRYIETRLDIFINSRLKITSVIDKRALANTAFKEIASEMAEVPPSEIEKALERQLFMNSFFYGKRSRLLPPFTINGKMNRGLFYRNVKHNDRLSSLDEPLSVRHPVTGATFETTYTRLFTEAGKKAVQRIRALNEYAASRISLQSLSETVSGEDLDTGMLGVTAREVKYFMPIDV